MELRKHVEKEQLSELNFTTTEVLQSRDEIAYRRWCLERAVILGNADKVKSRVVFQTVDGTYDVFTTVWAFTDTHIILKGGVLIPVHAILKVEQ